MDQVGVLSEERDLSLMLGGREAAALTEGDASWAQQMVVAVARALMKKKLGLAMEGVGTAAWVLMIRRPLDVAMVMQKPTALKMVVAARERTVLWALQMGETEGK